MRYFIGDSWLLSDVCHSHSHLRLQVKINSCKKKKKNIKAFYLPFIMWRLAILQTSQLELITAIVVLLLSVQPFSRLLDAVFYLFHFAKRFLPHYYSLKLENIVLVAWVLLEFFFRGLLEAGTTISTKQKCIGERTGNTQEVESTVLLK